MKSSFLIKSILLAFSCTLIAVLVSASTYGTTLSPCAFTGCAGPDPVAYWALEDLPTFTGYLRNHIGYLRRVDTLPSGPSVGYAYGYPNGLIQYRLADTDAITGHSIKASFPGTLRFPLTSIDGSSVMNFHAWVRFTVAPESADEGDETPFLAAHPPSVTSFQLTSRRLSFGGVTVPLTPSVPLGTGWNLVGLVVEGSPSSTHLSVFVNAVLAGQMVSSASWVEEWMSVEALPYSQITVDNVALSRGAPETSTGFLRMYQAGLFGACLADPCFSGVTCTPHSSSRFSCGSCPHGSTGDGITCAPISVLYPVDYHCFSPPSSLGDATYCATNCLNRFSCMSCSVFFEPPIQEAARGHCETVFYSERSASHTPTHTATSSASSTGTVTSSITPTSSMTSTTTASVTPSVTASNTAPVTVTPTVSISWSSSVTPTRTPSPSQLMQVQTFDSSTGGWINNGGTINVQTSSCGSFGTILCGYNLCSSGSIRQTFAFGAHTSLTIQFKFVRIDSWDGESGYLDVDSIRRWSQSASHGPGGGSQQCGQGYSTWNEEGFDVNVTFAHTASSVTVVIGSTLDQDPTDESWGMDNFRIFSS